MSKNIEEIVEDIVPELTVDCADELYRNGFSMCKDMFKQAITEGKLVVPMSLEDIQHILYNDDYINKALGVYQAQFGGNK